MLVDLLALVLAIVAVGLVPVVMMALLFGIVRYLSDEQKLEEIRAARREGRAIDFSETDPKANGEASEERSPVTPPAELETDVPAGPERSTADSAASTTCSQCGKENEAAFDRCWNCQAAL